MNALTRTRPRSAPHAPAVRPPPVRTERPTAAPRAVPSSFEAAPVRAAPVRPLEPALTRAGVAAPLRARITGQLDALPPADRARERALLDRAVAGPNGARAAATWSELETMRTRSRAAATRLTPEVRETLVRGVSERRSADDLGIEGVMGRHQAVRAARTLVDMPRARYDEVTGLRASAGTGHRVSPSADPQAERALLLDGVAARSEALTRRGARGTAAMTELRDFAADVRGLPRNELIRTTTALDVSRANDSATSVTAPGTRDVNGDNDGLTQRFETSCGPATAELARAELDPVYARQLHREGLTSGSRTGSVADEQRRVLERGGGAARSRESVAAAHRAHDAITAAHLAPANDARVRTYLRGERQSVEDLMAVSGDLETIRRVTPGALPRADVDLIRREHGVSRGMELPPALDAVARRSVHGRYDVVAPSAGMSGTEVDRIARRLEAGGDVPLRLTDATNSGGHFLLVSDVRGTGADQRFLVSDPWSGRTAWVDRAALTTRGTTAFDRNFGVGWDRVSHAYLPPE